MFAPLGWLKGPGARRVYRSIQASGQFDARWYRKHYLSKASLTDALWHYLDRGWQQGYDPSPHFDTSHYIESSIDVQSSGINPLFHFIEYGHEERRAPVRSPLQTLRHYFPDATPLEMFRIPSEHTDRVTAIVDNYTPATSDGDWANTWAATMKSPLVGSRQLRVLSRVSDFSAVAHSIEHFRQKFSFPSEQLELVNAHALGKRASFSITAGEHFLATSWTSALAISQLAPAENLWAITGSVNSSDVGPLNTNDALSTAQSHEHQKRTTDKALTVPERLVPQSDAQQRVLVVTDKNQRFTYCHTMRALEDLMLKNASLAEALSVSIAGEEVAPISLAERPLRVVDPATQACDLVINVSAHRIRHPRVLDVVDHGGNDLANLAQRLQDELAELRPNAGGTT